MSFAATAASRRAFIVFMAILLPAFACMSVLTMVVASLVFESELSAAHGSGGVVFAALFIGLASAALAGALGFWAANRASVPARRAALPPENDETAKDGSSAPPALAAAAAAPPRETRRRAAWAPRFRKPHYVPKALPAPEGGAPAAETAPAPAAARAGHLIKVNTPLAVTTSERDRLVGLLRQAMNQGYLRLFYQPIVALDGLSLAGAEALLRIQDPDNGMLPPAEFIRVAEETGLMSELGDWVLGEGLSTVTALDNTSGLSPQYLSINLSPRQLEPSFMTGLVANLARAPEIARRVVFEISESVMLEGDERIIGFFDEVRQTGARIALDDFGTGYASLGYVNRYPVDIIKLDRSFIGCLDAAPSQATRQNLALVKAAAVMAKELGVAVVAEGIETPAQCEAVRAIGIGYGQGYLFSAPLPESEYRDWAEAFSRRSTKRLGPSLKLIPAA